MNLLPAGMVDEVLAGGGASKEEIHKFLRLSHQTDHNASGESFAAIGVLESGAVWVLTGRDGGELEQRLREEGVLAAEVLKLTTLH